MSKVRITIIGKAMEEPKLNEDGTVELKFTIPMTQAVPKGLDGLGESNYLVRIVPKTWRKVAEQIDQNSVYIIEGEPKASVDYNTPFIKVICFSINVKNECKISDDLVQRIEKHDTIEELIIKNKTLEIIITHPENTEDYIDITRINVPEKIQKPSFKNKRFLNALKLFIMNKGFIRPLTVDRSSMEIVANFHTYWAAVHFGLEMVPVTYFEMSKRKLFEEVIYIHNLYTPNEVIEMNIKDIVLTEEVHLNGRPVNLHSMKAYTKINKIEKPLIVRNLNNGKYALVMGYKRYVIAKLMDYDKVPVVIKNKKHYELVKELDIYDEEYADIIAPKGTQSVVRFGDIRIPNAFLQKRVRKEKLDKEITYFRENGHLSEPIIIDNQNILVDGYSRYVTAKCLGIKKLPIKFIEK